MICGGVRRPRSRQRAVWLWLAGLLLASLVFRLWPTLDMAVATAFYSPDQGFAGEHIAWMGWVYHGAPRLGQALFVLGVLVGLGRWCWPRQVPRWFWRRMAAWMLVVVLGVGLFVHEALKNRMGRPRPEQIVQMGGQAPYVPIYTVSAWCQSNCSFVSGHAAIGFSVMGLGMWAPLRHRRRWWLGGWVLGMGIGGVRIAQGGHFLSDIVFAGLTVWASALLIRWAWLHWRVRRRRRARQTP